MIRILWAIFISASVFARGKAEKTEIVGRYGCSAITKAWKMLEYNKRSPYRPAEGVRPDHAWNILHGERDGVQR